MKKLTTVFATGTMAALMLAGMVGCGATASKKVNEQTTQITVTAEAASTENMGEETDGTEVMASNFAKLLEDIYATKAGSAGSSERVEAAADELATFVSDFSGVISYQNMDALAEEELNTMQEEYGDDFVDNFSEEFDAVTEAAMSENEDLETDVTFDQVVNAVTNALDMMM